MATASYFTDTIVALSSGPVPSGVAVLRVSGPGAREALTMIAGGITPPRQAVLRTFRDGAGGAIDRGIVIHFPGPASFTGEDACEFQTHGSPAVVRALLAALAALDGFRLAEAGEFTRRAFVNGKLDLLQAEALSDLLRAETESQRRLAVRKSAGEQSARYEAWRAALLTLRARAEAALDFSDEGDVPDEIGAGFFDSVTKLSLAIGDHLAAARSGEIVSGGFRVVLAGLPNAGKSSLLNALAKRDVAIVTDQPGTTRDLIDVRLELDGCLVVVTDTAGLRPTSDQVERIGVERAMSRAREADLVVVLNDGSGVPPEVAGIDASRRLVIDSKADLRTGDAGQRFAVSAKTGEGLGRLLEEIARRARDAAGSPDSMLPTRERHLGELRTAISELDLAATNRRDVSLSAEHLRRAGDALGRLTGHIDVEDVLGEIFSTFCVGK